MANTAAESLGYTLTYGGQAIIGEEHPSVKINATQAQKVTQTFAVPFDLPKYHTYIIESEVQSPGASFVDIARAGRPRTLTPVKQYKLPLPLQLSRRFDVNYDTDFNFLNMGATAVDLAAQVLASTGLGGAAAGVASSLIGAGATAIKNPNVRQAVGAIGGLAINTYKSVTLNEPRFQEFTMAWKFAPKTFSESIEIQRLVTSIKQGMHPYKYWGTFGFPRVFSVGIIPNSKFLTKFKPAVVQSINVDYQGGNPAPAFYNTTDLASDSAYSPPESVIVSMSFIELEFWLREDFQGENLDALGLPSNNPFVTNGFEYITPPPPPLPSGPPVRFAPPGSPRVGSFDPNDTTVRVGPATPSTNGGRTNPWLRRLLGW